MAKRYNPNENNAAAAAALTDQGALIPPQAIELEEAVLGALMLEKDAIIEIQGVLDARGVLQGSAPDDLQGDHGLVDGAQADRPVHRQREAQADPQA